jgi:polyisoprenoid-binding protein YceI
MSITTASTLDPTGTWSVDPARARVEFQVKQLGIVTLRVAFNKFDGTLELGDDLVSHRSDTAIGAASGVGFQATVRGLIVSRCGSCAGTHVAWFRSSGR